MDPAPSGMHCKVRLGNRCLLSSDVDESGSSATDSTKVNARAVAGPEGSGSTEAARSEAAKPEAAKSDGAGAEGAEPEGPVAAAGARRAVSARAGEGARRARAGCGPDPRALPAPAEARRRLRTVRVAPARGLPRAGA